MGTDSIRSIIAAAIEQEVQLGTLESEFLQRLPELGSYLQLPPQSPAKALVAFVVRYIEYVPDFIETVSRRGAELDLSTSVNPFLHMAEDFFLAPPEDLGENSGLKALMDEAFLAQRLIEELNDRHIQLKRTQLMPVDMTRANIIVH